MHGIGGVYRPSVATMGVHNFSGPVRPSRAEDESAEDRKHGVSAMQCGGEPNGGIIQSHNDGVGTYARGEEEGESKMQRLRTRDGGGVPQLPSHVTAWEGKGTQVDLDRGGNRIRGPQNLQDRVSKGKSAGIPSRRVPGKSGDKDGDACALMEKARAGHGDNSRGGEPPTS